MTSAVQQHDLLLQQLSVVERRIDWHLDNQDRARFLISCQIRDQIKARLLALVADPVTELEAA